MRVFDDMDWRDGAACTGIDSTIFVPSPTGREHYNLAETQQQALRICNDCPVIDDCLDYAMWLPGGVEGVWGGIPTRELRSKLRRQTIRRMRLEHEGQGTMLL